MFLRPDPFVITSSLSTERAVAALDELPRWRTRDGLQGRRHHARLTLTLDEPRRGLVIPVLRAVLDTSGKHLVLRGEVRPMRVALVPLVLPLLLLVGAFFSDGGGRFILLGLAIAGAAWFGFLARGEAQEFAGLSTELQRRVAHVLTGNRRS